MRDLSIIFAALADPTRLEMLALLLRSDELCVCDFVGALGISQSKASRHLRYMWNARLLDDRRASLWVYYRIARKLDPERQVLVQALAQVFGERDLSELDDKLAQWRKRKAKTMACSVVPAREAPTRTRARASKPRREAEALR